MRNNQWCHLHLHTQYSVLDGYGSAEQYAERAKEIGFTHMAITDHGNVDGAIQFQKACEANDITPIIGCEAYIVPDMSNRSKEKRYHISLFAMNSNGWQNILKMLTVANMQGFYYRPRIDPELLLEHCDGVLVSTACCYGYLRMPNGADLIKALNEVTEVVLEVMPVDMKEQREVNRWCLDLSESTGIPIIATNDCHYILKDQSKLQETLLAVQRKVKWNDPNRWKFDIDDLYLKTADEMVPGLVKQGVERGLAEQVLRNTMLIAEKCSFRIEQVPVTLPDIHIPGYEELPEDDQLTHVTLDGLNRLSEVHSYIDDDIDSYYDRVEDELYHIINLGFSRYFLIVWELIDWCKKNNILTGPGRGSVGGSLVAYCLGITAVDPIKYGLVFTRFISPARIDLPDIDMDFEDRHRGKIRKHLEYKYGKYNVIGLSTFAKMNGRSCLRDVARVFDVPLVDVGAAAKSIVVRSVGDFRSSFTITDAFDTFEDGKKFKKKYPEVTRISIAMEGQIRGTGKHAAAMCVSANDVRSGVHNSLSYRSKELLANWGKEDAEYMGLMKLDVLGLNALTVLAESISLVKDRHGIEVDLETIPLDDEKVYSEFSRGNTVGVFQFAGQGAIKLCREIGVENFDELVAVNALNRPGPLRSGMTTDYTNIKHGKKKKPNLHPIMNRITENTQGMVIYQEQIMFIISELAGLPWRTADVVRKVISKGKGEEQFMKFKDMFVEGCVNKGTISRKEAEKAFKSYKHAGSYMFNKSHAVEYSLIAYWEAWFKTHYPVEYMVGILSYGPTHKDKKHIHVNEAKRLGVKLALPNINKSMAKLWTADEEGNLRIPLCEIKGIGPAAANVIVSERKKNGDYTSKNNFESRVEKRRCNKRVKELLDKVGVWEEDSDALLDDKRLEELSLYFDFDLSNDPMFRYRKAVKKISEHVDLVKLKGVSTKQVKEKSFYFGYIASIKYGYKEKVGQNKKDDAGLGGVYAYFEDSTNSTMLTFNPELYKNRKDEIEHCAERWALVRANSPFGTDSLYCNEIWFADDILSGKLDDSGIALADEYDYSKSDLVVDGVALSDCQACQFRQECKAPVYPTYGDVNAMIIGEAPGKDEDRVGKGFVGGSGNLLFDKNLHKIGVRREHCHITNVNKCWPSKSRTPKKTQVNKCRKWLDREIEIVKPFVILALGNTCMKYFLGEDSGIMAKNASTEWNDRYNCWICWGIHPASVLRSPENRTMFKQALDNFAHVFSTIGFGL